jgi:trimeric autotransporter adhesin
MKYTLLTFLIGISFCSLSQNQISKAKTNVKKLPITKADFIRQTLNPSWKVNAVTEKNAKVAGVQAYCSCQASPLAVSSITLEAVRINTEKVVLNWKATEQTTENKFGIERSIDAKTFINIDFLIWNNSNQESDYYYEDTNDNQSVTYYRIKENDLAGKVIYSNIVAVTGLDRQNEIIISPNPSADKISISLNSEGNSNGSFSIFTASGRQVLQKSVLFEKGKNNATIDISEFAVGTYFLQINNGKNKTTKKVVKR